MIFDVNNFQDFTRCLLPYIAIMLFFIVIDTLMGIISIKYREDVFDEAYLWKSVLTNTAMILVVLAFSVFDLLFNLGELIFTRFLFLFFMIWKGMSILENASMTNLPIPKSIKTYFINRFEQMHTDEDYDINNV